MDSHTDAVSSGNLFSKTMMVLTGMMGLGAVGAFVGAGITSLGAVIALVIGWLVLTVIAVKALSNAKDNPGSLPLASFITAGWTFMSGLVMGPGLAMAVNNLGPQTVFGAFLGTAGIMAVCGAIGMLSGLNFSRLASVLGLALWGLIIVGLFGMFFAFSSGFNMLYCAAGLVIFSGYFIVDFWRLKEHSSENDWPTAMLMAMMLYLDFVNVLMYLIQLIEESRKN